MAYIGTPPSNAFTSLLKQDFSTSATTGYTLDHAVNNANDIALFINFVRQEPTAAYSASGTTLTLTSATASSDDMYCVYLGQALQTVNPPNDSVGASQLVDASITSGKLASGVLPTNTPTFLAKLSADQTLSNATYTKANFNTEVFDPQSTYDNSTNYRFTPGVAGKYFIYGQADLEGSNITANWIIIKKNGSNLWGSHHDASGHTYTTQYIGVTDIASATDYYEIFVYLDTSGTPKLKADFGGSDMSFFGAYKIIE